jgi:hypothetical protein
LHFSFAKNKLCPFQTSLLSSCLLVLGGLKIAGSNLSFVLDLK